MAVLHLNFKCTRSSVLFQAWFLLIELKDLVPSHGSGSFQRFTAATSTIKNLSKLSSNVCNWFPNHFSALSWFPSFLSESHLLPLSWNLYSSLRSLWQIFLLVIKLQKTRKRFDCTSLLIYEFNWNFWYFMSWRVFVYLSYMKVYTDEIYLEIKVHCTHRCIGNHMKMSHTTKELGLLKWSKAVKNIDCVKEEKIRWIYLLITKKKWAHCITHCSK